MFGAATGLRDGYRGTGGSAPDALSLEGAGRENRRGVVTLHPVDLVVPRGVVSGGDGAGAPGPGSRSGRGSRQSGRGARSTGQRAAGPGTVREADGQRGGISPESVASTRPRAYDASIGPGRKTSR